VPTVHFTIDPQQNVSPISRFIYGVNQSLDGAYANNTFTRMGGNRLTAYNWENNASNAGSDFQFQNDGFLGGGNTPGGAVIPVLQNASARNAGALITIPINGYVAADKNGGGDVRNSGSNYLQTRFRQEVARKGAPFTLTPDPNDPFVYQDEFVNWVKTNFPYALTDPNRPIFFSLDNEPDLWSSTHAEVHPAATTYAELVQKTIDYASAIKDVMPGTQIFGPVNYGWQGYVNLQNAPDANGRDFLTFYLQQMQQADAAAGHRLVDVLDVHWYPEATGGGVRITGQDTTPAVVAARLQAPRSLWDPTYTETSWITQFSTQGPIDLLPRLKGKISANDPGMKLSISEYNYGGGADISGGIAEADVLGIFGRDGVFAANEWPLASPEPFIGGAFQMYRNFDGHNGTFGDTSVLAQTDDVPDTSVYGSVDSANPNVMTLVALNKTNQPVTSVSHLNHVAAGASVDIYQLTAGSSTPQFVGRVTVTDPANFTYTMPAYSVTTLRIVSNAVTPSFTFDWTGTQSSDWFNAQNWTDANDSTHHAVPGTADTAVIVSATNDPVLTAAATVAGLQVTGGTLTLNGTLTDTGAFTQTGGTVNLNANTLQVAGNVTRTGGATPGTTGVVELNGTAGQAFLDTSFNKLPGLLISNTSAAGVTLPGGSNVGVRTGGSGITVDAGSTLTLLQGAAASFLIDRGNFTDNGKIVLSQLSPNGGPNTAPITINGTLAFGGTSALDLTVGSPARGAVYTFVTYGATTGTPGTTTVHVDFPFGANPAVGATALTVTLTSPGTTDTWTGTVSNDWFTAANWTAADGSHVVPGASDLAVIKGAPFATVLNSDATVGSLRFANGFLTLNANLTVTGTFNPDSGFIAFGSNADQLILDGDVTRKSGTFLGKAGTVVFNGAAQSVTDTSGRSFGWNVVVNSGSAVTVQQGSAVRVGNDFTENGTLNLSVSAPGNATAPLVVGGAATLASGSHLNLAMGGPASGVTYLFMQFGILVDNGVVFGFSGQGGFTPTAHKNPNSLTVTLA
jgi:hypothetical protein